MYWYWEGIFTKKLKSLGIKYFSLETLGRSSIFKIYNITSKKKISMPKMEINVEVLGNKVCRQNYLESHFVIAIREMLLGKVGIN